MTNKREELINRALMDKLTGGIDIYNADDILIVADISEAELREFHEKIQRDIQQIASKKKTGD